MHRILITLVAATTWLALVSSAHAAPVTVVDFDAAPAGTNFGLETQGYAFDLLWYPGPVNIAERDASGDQFIEPIFGPIKMNAADGSLFNLHSLDIYFFDPTTFGGSTITQNDADIRAFDSEGELITEISVPYADGLGWRTLEFDSTWSGIDYLELGYTASFELTYGGYDNIAVSTVVPLPAAVWLFGSALFGLGVIRRGQKAVQR